MTTLALFGKFAGVMVLAYRKSQLFLYCEKGQKRLTTRGDGVR